MLGQICCDSNGKLNAQSVLLEAGPEQGGQQVPVDLSELKDYSLFPGQVSQRTLLIKQIKLQMDFTPNCAAFCHCLPCILPLKSTVECILIAGLMHAQSGGHSFSCALSCV